MGARGSQGYRLTVRGRVSGHLASAFDGMATRPAGHDTVLEGRLADPAALYGVIDRLRDFGLELLTVSAFGSALEGAGDDDRA